MKIGIYGGTFNPPHLGHLEAARTAVKVLNLDLLLLVPAGTPPHKDLPEDTPSPEDRLAMTRLTADAMMMPDIVQVSNIEISRKGKSYTADTVEELHRQYPGAELYLLMGTDMFLSFQNWHDAKTIARLAGLINSPGAEAVTPDQADDCIDAILRHGRVKEEKEVVQMDDGQWAEYIRSTIAARKQNR